MEILTSMKKKYIVSCLCISFLCILTILLFFRIQKKQVFADPITKSSFLLDTIVTVTIYDSDDMELLENCLSLCEEYENLFSKTIDTVKSARSITVLLIPPRLLFHQIPKH